MGFRQFRVRHHGDIVRIEIARDELPRALSPEMAEEFTRIFKALGFSYVTLDLEGFRSGSMNAVLPVENAAERQRFMCEAARPGRAESHLKVLLDRRLIPRAAFSIGDFA